TPEPALIAFCRAVYWSLPVPALTRSTLTFGYSAWKSVTTLSRVGSQAQTVMVPPSSRAFWRSASETEAAAVSCALPGPPAEPQPAAASDTARGAPARRVRRRVVVIDSPFGGFPGVVTPITP